MAKVNKVWAQERSMFGEFAEEAIQEPGITGTYIGGYSDKRTEAELARAKGENPEPLPHRFQMVPFQRVSGTPYSAKIAEFKKKGYEVVNYEEAEKLGYDLSFYQKSPEGNATIGDSILMICDGKTAAKLDYQHQTKLGLQMESVAGELLDRKDEQGRPVFELEESITQDKR